MPTSRSFHLSRRALLAAAGAAAAAAEPVRLPHEVRVAVWGLDGHAGEITKPLALYPDVEIAGVQDASLKKAQSYGRGKAAAYTDAVKMLDELKPDLVAVCNNDGERAAAILECARRKLPVIAEKPLSITRVDLEKIRKAVASSGIKLGMLLPMRFDPQFLALKDIVASGEIGEVIQISSQKSYKLGERAEWMRNRATYGSTILWIGIHMFDLMRWTSGREMKAASSFMGVAGDLRAGEMETTTATSFRLDNGGTACLHMDYCRPAAAPTHNDDRLRLAGTRGVAEYMAATGVTLVTTAKKPQVIEKLPAGRSIFAEFLDYVYLGKPTSLPHAEIFKLCEITLAAHEAAISGKVVTI
ncbi:MAG: Gfo/Idh/MocA family oxidoreductase [Acidobacteria bacterium]|nr:Gfo/Idh/MocA family oxidoreductase [Acidobacteriota bacterium]